MIIDQDQRQEFELAEDRHWWFLSRTLAINACLDPLKPAAPRVLDIGSGAGNMAHHLSRYGAVIGVDNNLKPLQVAWERGLCSLPASAANLPFATGTFGLVALLDVLEHCPDDDAVIAEAYRVLQPGGLVVVTSPAFPWLWSYNDTANQHLRRYTKAGLRQKLRFRGFQVVRLTYTYFLVFPAAAGLIFVRRLLGARPSIATPAEDDAYQVEMEPVPSALNTILSLAGRAEAALLRRFSLPVGTAVLAVARKPC